MIKTGNKAADSLPVSSPRLKKPWARRCANIIIVALILLALIALGGFVRFADDIAELQVPKDIANSDAIVVLTGGNGRIPEATKLLKEGTGKRLLISGVNPEISDNTLRKVTGASQSLFNCCVDVGRDAKDTIGNSKEIASWAEKHGFKSLVVVTSNYHMLRSLYELESVTENVEFTAYPVINTDLKTSNWYNNPDIARILINEYVKLNLAYTRKFFGIKSGGNLYSE